MILDTENILSVGRVTGLSSTTVWATPTHLDHRVAQLEATVQAQSAELRNLRVLIMNLTTVLRMYEGDNR